MSDFDPLKQCLALWPRQCPPDTPLEDHACERLRSVLHGIWHDPEVPRGGRSRRTDSTCHSQAESSVSTVGPWAVPLGTDWPDSELWRKSGLNTISERLNL